MIDGIALVVATAGYVGCFPVAPGTVGSLVGLGLWVALRLLGAGPGTELAAALALLVAGAWAAGRAERRLGVTDPGPVVIDEVLGMCIALAGAPLTMSTAVASFLLFRAFDIVKPPPARQLERAHGGWGIMLDDVAAGLYAWAVLTGMRWLVPGWWS